MGMSLKWKPVVNEKFSLSRILRDHLRRFLETDTVRVTLSGENDEDMLKCFAIAGVEDADVLLNALIKHGEIEVFEEC